MVKGTRNTRGGLIEVKLEPKTAVGGLITFSVMRPQPTSSHRVLFTGKAALTFRTTPLSLPIYNRDLIRGIIDNQTSSLRTDINEDCSAIRLLTSSRRLRPTR